MTNVRGYRLQVLGYRAQVPDRQCRYRADGSEVPGRQVAGARPTGCRCQANRLQVPGKQVAGAGQTGCRCRANRLQVWYTGPEVQGISPISPGC